MAEVNAKDLTTKTTPASTDSMLLFGTTSNEGAKITVDNLADNILSRLTTKTFANQVGGNSAATILAQLATLNSNTWSKARTINSPTNIHSNITCSGGYLKMGNLVVFNIAITYSDLTQSGTSLLNLPAPLKSACFTSASMTTGATSAHYYLTSSGILKCYEENFQSSSVQFAVSGSYLAASAG